MQTTLLWTGREYYSLENCFIIAGNQQTEINSVIIGRYNDKLYRVEYIIQVNSNWEIQSCELKTLINNKKEKLSLRINDKEGWSINGKSWSAFEGCTEVDIPLTPFTNSLPINRLKMQVNDQQEIKVVYIDILENEIKPVKQKYHRLSESEYKYENVPNDFEAVIRVDESGFVVDYPELFVKTANY